MTRTLAKRWFPEKIGTGSLLGLLLGMAVLVPGKGWAHGEVEGGGKQDFTRLLKTEGETYQLYLMYSPSVPTVGEPVNLGMDLKRLLATPDPLLGSEVPVAEAPGLALVDQKSGRIVIERLPLQSEAAAGSFEFNDYKFPKSGSFFLRVRIQPAGGEPLTADFPITVQANMAAFFRFWVNLAVALLILGLTGMQLWKVRLSGGHLPQMIRPLAIGAACLVVVVILMNFFIIDQVLAMRKPKVAGGPAETVALNEDGSYTIPKAVQQELGLALVAAKQVPLGQTVATFGTVAPDARLTADVLAPFWGRIEFSSKPLVVGDRVEKGQELVLLTMELSAVERGPRLEKQKNLKGTLEEAKKRLDATQVEYERYQKLSAANPAYEADLKWAKELYDEAKKIYDEIDAQDKNYTNALKLLDPRKTGVPSPIKGTITAVNFVPGQLDLTDEFKKLFTIVDTSRVWVWTQVYLYDAWKVKVGDPAFVSPAEGGGNPLPGAVRYIDDAVDPTGRSLRVLVDVPNPEQRLALGSFVRVVFSRQQRGLVVPVQAVVDEGNRQYVYVARDTEKFEPLTVELGVQQDGYWQVLSGLEEGDQVIAKGAGLLGSFRQEQTIPAPTTATTTAALPGS